MASGFVVERSGLFLRLLAQEHAAPLERGYSFWIGIALILLGPVFSIIAIMQYRKTLRTLKPIEIPEGYAVNLSMLANLTVAVLGTALIFYLFQGPGL
jgi:putative membrane protein